MNRRQFLSTGTTCAALGIATPGAIASLLKESGNVKFSKQWFQQALNTQFQVDDKGWQGVSMKLVAVLDGPQSRGLEQFSTVFHARHDNQLTPGLYHVKHPSDGWFQVYLEHGQTNDDGMHYQATFNLLA